MAASARNHGLGYLNLGVAFPNSRHTASSSSSQQSTTPANQQDDQTNAPKTIVGVGSSFMKMFVGNAGEFMFFPRGYSIEVEHLSNHWFNVTGPSSSVYRVWIEGYLDSLVMRAGWPDLVEREGIDQGDICYFTRTEAMAFTVTIMTRGGMQKAPVTRDTMYNSSRNRPVVSWQDVRFFRNKGVNRSHRLVNTLYSIWVASRNNFILYASHMKQTAIESGTVILGKDVSARLPNGPVRIGLVFDGSRIIYDGIILKRADHHARIIGGWIDFVRGNGIKAGRLYVFKFEVCERGWQVTLYQV